MRELAIRLSGSGDVSRELVVSSCRVIPELVIPERGCKPSRGPYDAIETATAVDWICCGVYGVGIPIHVISAETDVGSLTRASPAFTMTKACMGMTSARVGMTEYAWARLAGVAGRGLRLGGFFFVMEIETEMGFVAGAADLEGNLGAGAVLLKERIDRLQQK
jgi:hypothetical protein